MRTISPTTLKSVAWFAPKAPPKPPRGLAARLGEIAVAGAVGGLFFAAHRPTLAYVVWGVGGALAALSLAAPKARAALDGLLARFGRAVGVGLGNVLLGAVFLLVVTPLRFVRRALGADDLHLRDGQRQSFWLACDDEARKARWVGSMFATEAPKPGGGSLRAALVFALVALAIVEGVLRLKGFGKPVLYVADPDVGYYPQPNLTLTRYGGRVSTNEFGMRSPAVTKAKAPGTFRVLMLGDSTLYGGSYVDQDDLYATLVRKDLEAKGLAGKVEVLAMGCNGWGPFHERAFVAKNGTFDADVVMIHLPIDDVNRPLYGMMSVPFFPVQAPPRLALEEVANHLMWRYRGAHSGLDDAWESRQAEHGIAEYGRLVDDVRRAGAEPMVFVLPSRTAGFGGDVWPKHAPWIAALERTARAHGATYHFAKGYFEGKGAADEIYYDHTHLDVKGHRVYASYIEAALMNDSKRFRAFAGVR